MAKQVTFYKNRAQIGGSVDLETDCTFEVDGNSNVTFHDNTGMLWSGALSVYGKSSLCCKGSFTVTFFANKAIQFNGGIIYSLSNSTVNFAGSTKILFTKNHATRYGGDVVSKDSSYVHIAENTSVTFSFNYAKIGGAALFLNNGDITITGNSVVMFNNNEATGTRAGGSISSYNSKILFKESSVVHFNYNLAKYGGVLYSDDNTDIIFYQNCTVTFDGNTAEYGGAVYLTHHSSSLFTGRSLVTFQNNAARKQGGGIYLHNTYNVKVKLCNNMATNNSEAIFLEANTNLLFEESSRVIINNRATLTDRSLSSQTILENVEESLHKSTIDFINITSNKSSINSTVST